jgi:capsular exopolysaccharide synthesis family protein
VSRVYDALRRLETDRRGPDAAEPDVNKPAEVLDNISPVREKLADGPSANINAGEKSRLVALSDPKSLGAEKFRALVGRLENLRHKRQVTSLQVTSSVVNEGKSLVAANLAITLVMHSQYRVLLVEGDLHRPTLSTLLGLTNIPGINQWWDKREGDGDISQYIYKLDDTALSFLGAGSACDQPSQILQSARFAEMFTRLAGAFDWVIVDSTPMSPVVDANLWSRLVDGTLLVVREGVAPLKALQKGIKGLDNPKWLGMVLNEASEFDRVNYTDQYYGINKKPI